MMVLCHCGLFSSDDENIWEYRLENAVKVDDDPVTIELYHIDTVTLEYGETTKWYIGNNDGSYSGHYTTRIRFSILNYKGEPGWSGPFETSMAIGGTVGDRNTLPISNYRKLTQ